LSEPFHSALAFETTAIVASISVIGSANGLEDAAKNAKLIPVTRWWTPSHACMTGSNPMTAPIDLWFSVGSTYTYLTVMRLSDVAERTAVRFNLRPFSV